MALLAVALASLAGAGQAAADCQLQWQPDPFGESGGSLVPICDDPTAPTGDAGESGDGGGKAGERESSYAAIAVNMTTLADGDGELSGAASAGHRTKAIAIREAVRACRRNEPGECKSVVSAKDGWAALVVTADQARRLHVFGGSGRSYEAAFGAATRRARAAMGAAIAGPIERVQAVRSRPQ
jgi:hypothetical protein